MDTSPESTTASHPGPVETPPPLHPPTTTPSLPGWLERNLHFWASVVSCWKEMHKKVHNTITAWLARQPLQLFGTSVISCPLHWLAAGSCYIQIYKLEFNFGVDTGKQRECIGSTAPWELSTAFCLQTPTQGRLRDPPPPPSWHASSNQINHWLAYCVVQFTKRTKKKKDEERKRDG